jgi:hypothetical protein
LERQVQQNPSNFLAKIRRKVVQADRCTIYPWSGCAGLTDCAGAEERPK